MKLKLTIFLLVLVSVAFAQTQKVNIQGFGEISATKRADNKYDLDFNKYGKFIATGTIDPIALQIETTLEDLREFPGYKLYEKLDLQEIKITAGQEGLKIDAGLDTKKNFGDICKMLKISNPEMGVSIALSKTKFKLEGELSFERDPIIIDVVPDFSRFTLETMGIEAEAAAGEGEAELSLGFAIQTRWKPTEWDPDIQSVTAFSYNLTTNEISASASMTDTWSNPMLLNKLLKPNSVVFTDVAAALDWPIGSPAPSGFGFTVGQAKFFDLDFGAFIAMTPSDKKIAVQASRNQITMNDFSRILRNGFGLKVPDIFPDNVYIKDVVILFSPTGGEVGEFEVQKGFILRGKANFMDGIIADVDYSANLDDGFRLNYKMASSFETYFKNVFRNDPKLKYISGELVRSFNVKKLEMEANASMDLNMSGRTYCEFQVLGKTINFELEGKFSAEALKDKILEEITNVAGPHAAAVMDAVGKGVKEAGKVAQAAVGTGSGLVNKYAKLGAIKAQHTHILDGGEKYCRKHCIPNRAKHLTDKVLPNAKRSVQTFHDRVIFDLMYIEGENANATKQMRLEKFGPEWNSLTAKIEKDWDEILSDKEYVGFFVSSEWARKGGDQFRNEIINRKKEYDNLKNQLINNLVSKVPLAVKYDRASGCGTFYKSGRSLKKHCGWRSTWHTITRIGATANSDAKDRFLFYDNNSGEIAFYQVDNSGNMHHTKTLGGVRKTWSTIRWINIGNNTGLISFELADGYQELYKCYDNGTIGLYAPITVKYNQSAGCGDIYRNGQLLKNHCGWRSTWHTILRVGTSGSNGVEDKLLFYDKQAGHIAFYRVDSSGNMHHLKSYDNMRKTWKSVTFESQDNCNGLIRFTQADGHTELYTCDDQGNLKGYSN